MAKEFHIPNPFKKLSGQPGKFQHKHHREINLVPDIKNEMIKTLKLRNFIFFLCIVVASASVGVTLLFGIIAGSQGAVIDGKKQTISNLSGKLKSYSDLDNFLTIKDQVGNISTLTDQKTVLSRTFDVLAAMIPTGADTIKISEMNVNLSEESPTYTFDAQADAGQEPFIDYNVLDSFKKSMKYLKYDYGDYVDREGNTIPAYCMIESGADGATLKDSTRGFYAYWLIDGEGCNPTADSEDESATANYDFEDYEGQRVVRIWRTPQFSEWYRAVAPTEGQPYMSLDGEISNVPHFESACISYSGDTKESESRPKWTDTNESCLIVPDGDSGINILESSNGRGASDELVLRFSAVITLNADLYNFKNHHFLAFQPSGRYNVTDSYNQVQAMFGERAADCAKDDTACNSNGGRN